jgi:deoxyribodipyrimidine photo-lyase
VAVHLPAAGAAEARARLEQFVAGPLATYADDRDRPAVAGTSGLSPYLRFGCIHPRTVLEQLTLGSGAERMRSELAWREFYADVLWHRPDSARQPLQPFGRHLRWDTGQQARHRFRAWASGRTGYPLVDAGMRQLLAEGWMHNRVRMVAASFLVKDLHIDWRLGARWFMWHLVDGDLASNQHNWQWVAGTGTDAAPFHRVFNPRSQQERFDPGGDYLRRYLGDVPISPGGGLLAGLSDAEVVYPEPLVDHAIERREALARFDDARRLTNVDKDLDRSGNRRAGHGVDGRIGGVDR